MKLLQLFAISVLALGPGCSWQDGSKRIPKPSIIGNKQPAIVALRLGKIWYHLDEEWPTEFDIIEIFGNGRKVDTKYGYFREYQDFKVCKKIRFYFESDDILARPASAIEFVDVRLDQSSASVTESKVGIVMAQRERPPRAISDTFSGVIYDNYEQNWQIRNGKISITLKY